MKKFASEMEKHAYYVGKARAYHTAGLTEGMIKRAFVDDGFSAHDADALVKLAILGAIGRGVIAGGRALTRGGSQLVGQAGKAWMGGQGGSAGMLGARALGGLGQLGQKAGRGLSRAGVAFARNPAAATGKGALEAGKGMLYGGGKGVGGALGKGAFGYSMYSMLKGPGQVQMPQAYGGSMMRPPYQQY